MSVRRSTLAATLAGLLAIANVQPATAGTPITDVPTGVLAERLDQSTPSDVRLRETIVRELARRGSRSTPALPALERAYRSSPTRTRVLLGRAIQRVDGNSKPLRTACLDALDTTDDVLRARAASLLGDLGADAGDDVPARLNTLLDDRNPLVRVQAAEALARLSPEEPNAARSLARSLASPHTAVRIQAAYACSSVGGRSRRFVIPALERAQRSDDDRLRAAAVIVLAEMEEDQPLHLAFEGEAPATAFPATPAPTFEKPIRVASADPPLAAGDDREPVEEVIDDDAWETAGKSDQDPATPATTPTKPASGFEEPVRVAEIDRGSEPPVTFAPEIDPADFESDPEPTPSVSVDDVPDRPVGWSGRGGSLPEDVTPLPIPSEPVATEPVEAVRPVEPRRLAALDDPPAPVTPVPVTPVPMEVEPIPSIDPTPRRVTRSSHLTKPLSDVRARITIGDDDLREFARERYVESSGAQLADDGGLVVHTIGTARPWVMSSYYWEASALAHGPLYFENPNSERYGFHRGPYLQPLVEAGRFYGSVAILPYMIGAMPPSERQYVLGHVRPGDCSPCFYQGTIRRGFHDACETRATLRGLATQAAATVGLIFIIP